MLHVDLDGHIAVLRLDRPEVRNALNRALNEAIVEAVRRLDDDPEVHVMVLTGTDPVFCAGMDLKEWAASADEYRVRPRNPWRGNFPPHRKPILGAVNGPVATGGLELALNCDFLVASERAAFADTHARVGVMPGAGVTVLLVQRIGLARAKELSLTGRWIDAATALSWGLVNHVVPHEELMPFVLGLAREAAEIEPRAMLRMRQTYEEIGLTTSDEAWQIEERVRAAWAQDGYDGSKIDQRRREVVERGRAHLGTSSPES
jgi:enoyl-CoA hydratase